MSGPWVVSVVCLWIVTSVGAVVVLGLLRRTISVLERLEPVVSGRDDGLGLPVGTVPGAFELADIDGNVIGRDALIHDPRIFLFMNPGCTACRKLGSELTKLGSSVRGVSVSVVVDAGVDAETLHLAADAPVLRQHASEATAAFRNRATPQAYLLAGGVVADRVIPRALDDLSAMVERWQEGGDADLETSELRHVRQALRLT